MGTPHEESSGLLPEVLKAVAGPVVSTVGTIATGALGRSWSNQDWNRQTDKLNQQAIANAKNSPLYTVEGLKRAGLNPALAAGSYTEAPVQSAPMQQHNMPVTPLDLTQMELIKANADLAESQAKKNEAETKDLNIEINRKNYEDATHSENFHEFFTQKANDREKEIRYFAKSKGLSEHEIRKMVSEDPWYRYHTRMSQRAANRGTSQAYRDFAKMLSEDAESAYNVIHYALHKVIEGSQKENGALLNKLINEPDLDWREKEQKIALMLAQTWASQASGDATYHKDLAAMINNADKVGIYTYLGEETVDFIEHMSPFMLLKIFRGSKGNKVAPTSQKAFDKLRGLEMPKGLTGNHDF